jgi:hypothetical protein
MVKTYKSVENSTEKGSILRPTFESGICSKDFIQTSKYESKARGI